MRIGIIVTRFPYGGAEKQALKLAKYFKQRTENVEIISIEGRTDDISEGIAVRGLSLQPAQLTAATFFSGLKYNLLLARKINRKYDIIISFNQNWFLGLLLHNSITKVLSIRLFYPNVISRLRRSLLSKYDIVITNNIPQYALMAALNLDVLLVNNSVKYRASGVKLKNNKIFLIVGNISRRKNYEVVFESFNSSKLKDFTLFVVGADEEKQYALHLKNQYSSENVIFKGHLNEDEVIALYDTCEAVIHPSFREGAANAILDSMSFGVPVIASRIPENVALIGNSNSNLFENESELIDCVKAVHENIESNSKRLHEYLAMQRMKIKFDYQEQDYKHLYDKILRIRK